MGNEKTDWMIYSDREMSVLSAQEEKVSFKELIKSLGMTQKEFSETFGIPMGTLGTGYPVTVSVLYTLKECLHIWQN